MWLLRSWVQPPVRLRTNAFIEALGYPDKDTSNRALPDLLENIKTERAGLMVAYGKVVPRKTDLLNFTSSSLYSGPPPSLKFVADSEEREHCCIHLQASIARPIADADYRWQPDSGDK